MIKQRAVDAGATEVRRFLQGAGTSRPLQPATNVPSLDQNPGYFAGGGGGPMQAPVQMQPNMPSQHGLSMAQADAAQQPHTVPLYVGVEAAPSFNLHQRLKGPGVQLGASCMVCVFQCSLACELHC